jgi:hypothetical protein
MSRLGPGARTVVTILLGLLLVSGGPAPEVRAAQATPDRSNVILVLDFSASILQDKANRNRFGAALERIAARVDVTSADLTAGDATVSIVQFATRAADLPGCVDLKLLNSAETVGRFADCLRSVAAAYRKGLAPALTRAIGVDTNYVAAMERANSHLPQTAARPTVILFTDGKHDVKGVPVGQVLPARDRLFGARSPFALLPVGMGLDPTGREALAAGLEGLRVIRDMPACVSGAVFDWPTAVFQSADEAGNAVAVALQNATCTFTAAPTATPTPAPTPSAIAGIRLTPGDARIEVAWTPAATTNAPIVDYAVRCRAGEDDWIESKEGVSLTPEATVDGLVNGTEYRCEVAAVGPDSEGAWTPAGTAVTPVGRPAPPAQPLVEAMNGAVGVKVPADDAATVSSYHVECSPDNGATWPNGTDVAPGTTTAAIGNLTNGVDYLCRAFAANAAGVSDPSPLSAAVRPCGSLIECNPIVLPIVGILGVVGAVGLLAVFVALYRGRTHGYVVAVVDIVHTANIGHGSTLGIGFERSPDTRNVTGIVADKGRQADIRIRRLRGGRFAIKDRTGKRIATDGEPVVVSDSLGGRHSLVLHAFATNPASRVASRR